jgi:hypothetical protein
MFRQVPLSFARPNVSKLRLFWAVIETPCRVLVPDTSAFLPDANLGEPTHVKNTRPFLASKTQNAYNEVSWGVASAGEKTGGDK